MNKIDKIKTLLGMEVKLEQMKLENGATVEAEKFEVGQEVFVLADEEAVPVPAGEYPMEDGKVLVVEQDGIIADIKDAEAKEEEAPKVEEEAELEAETTTPKKIIESISKEQFFSEIEKLRNEINELKLAKVELAKEEVAEGISHNPEALTKEKNNLSKNKRQTTLDRVFKQLTK